MDLTISSVLTTCFLNSIVALIFIFIFKRERVFQKVGPESMLVSLLLIILRMFLPIEFGYAYSVRVGEFLPAIRMALINPVFSEPIEITTWHLLCAVWISGIIVAVIYKLISYSKMMRCMKSLPTIEGSVFRNQYELEQYQELDGIKVFYSENIKTPCVMGVKTHYLLLPKTLCAEQQLYYVLLHEIMHIRNKDIVWKIILDLLCTVFWWNPVFSYLKKEFFRLIEMRNDIKIVSSLSETGAVQYMECLKDIAVQVSETDMAFGVSFSKNDLKELKRRIKLIVGKRFSKLGQIVVNLMVIICLVLTTTIVFEPFKLLDENEAEGTPVTADNTYLIKNEEQYDVYIDGEYFFTTDDLTPFPGVKIYNNLKEASENE